MTAADATSRSLARLAPIVVAPLLIVAAAWIMAPATGDRALEALVESIATRFETTIERLERVATAAVEQSPADAAALASRLGVDARRLEGLGTIDAAWKFERWRGTPATPPLSLLEDPDSRWAIRRDGVMTRLFVLSRPGATSRLGVVVFVVDSTLEQGRFARWIAPDAPDEIGIELALGEQPTSGSQSRGLSLGRDVQVTFDALPAELSRRLARQNGYAWAAIVGLLLTALLLPWRDRVGRPAGAALAALAIVGGRALMIWQHVPSRLFPREWGTPSLYGSAKGWGLLQSPADLLLSAGALYLLGRLASHLARRLRYGRVLSFLAAIGAAGALVAAVDSIARNCRAPLLIRPAPFVQDARLLLWLSLAVLALAAAHCGARALTRSRPALEPLTVALLLLLCGGASVRLQQHGQRLASEQIRYDYAPQIRDLASRRVADLSAAVHEIVDEFQSATLDEALSYDAFDAWVHSELFYGGHASSVDFYTPDGEPLDHFGFGLPALAEEIPGDAQDGELERIREEWIESLADTPRLLHSQAELIRDGIPEAIVVAHVYDMPENLPFLPDTTTYLTAMGAGVARGGLQPLGAEVEYLLYDAEGRVELSTIREPPARPPATRIEAADPMLLIVAGDEPYRAFPLGEPDGRLHLLLMPNWSVAERLGAATRLALLGLGVYACMALLSRRVGPRGLFQLLPWLRRSFHRKLLAALLLASILPSVGLALFLRGYLERRGDAALVASATQLVSAAQRLIEDYAADGIDGEAVVNGHFLFWLRRIVGQEVHVYRDGLLLASSRPEIFDSGLVAPRLDGEVQRRLSEGGLPHLVSRMAIGPNTVPVAYAPVILPPGEAADLVVSVPLLVEQRQIERGLSRVAEMIMLATVALVALLAVAAALLARTVARPVRELVGATGRIADGDYSTRLQARTNDEMAELVDGFNAMAGALAHQRSDLERRRDYTEALLRHAPTGVISLDERGRVVTLNPAARQILGQAQIAEGADFGEALSGIYEPLALAIRRTEAGEAADVDLPTEPPRRLRGVRVELRRQDNVSFGTLILLEDVTELMRSNQLAAWAEMARAIAHEIKNPLTPIQLSAEHLVRLLSDRNEGIREDERACIETIVKQVRALYQIAGEFSAYAKLPHLDPQPTDPAQFMREVIGSYRAASPPGIHIEERYTAAGKIAADPRVLGRAVINLIENALQAMAEGGTLTVSVEPLAGRERVALRVADSGPGLDPEVRRRLFEPYFSTKSSGTGLGLAIARRAVEAHGGTIDVSSRVNHGTTFTIALPMLADD